MANTESAENGSRAASLAAGMRRRIASGALTPGSRMPSVRALAKSSHVSPFTAARVYDVLVAEGLVEARRGGGGFLRPHHARWFPPPPPCQSGDSSRFDLVVTTGV